MLTAACAGAVLGGVWGWLYLTKSGGRVRDRILPAIDRISRISDELSETRASVEKTKAAIDEGRRLVTDVLAVGTSVS